MILKYFIFLVSKFQNSKENKENKEIKDNKDIKESNEIKDGIDSKDKEINNYHNYLSLNININEQKNSLEGAGSTTPDIDTFTKKKQTIENFLSSYGKLISKVENLMKKEKFKKLEEIVKIKINIIL